MWPIDQRKGRLNLQVEWFGTGKKARHPADPCYPDGVDIDLSQGVPTTYSAPLPYPASEIGVHIVQCRSCGQLAAITAVGRPDDPRSIKLACKRLRSESKPAD